MDANKAEFWERCKTLSNGDKESKDAKCLLCPIGCVIREGCVGACGVRRNDGGELIAAAYGMLTSVALDPIEKKPLYKFHSGRKLLSIGSYGCNFHCPFCQNYSISLEYDNAGLEYVAPEKLTELALRYVPMGNVGVAYTYNEPLINYEYVKDCCKLTREAGLVNVLVTNGYINKKPLEEILPFIDAMNIDFKGDAEGTYKMVGGTQDAVKKTIEASVRSCHVEVTTLVIPGENEDDVERIAKWLATVNKDIPYHLSRFFPRYKYGERELTSAETMYRLKEVAEKYLENVYLGNI